MSFTEYDPKVYFFLVILIYISCAGVIMSLHQNYIFIFIGLFLHHIMMSALICMRLLYNLIVCCT